VDFFEKLWKLKKYGDPALGFDWLRMKGGIPGVGTTSGTGAAEDDLPLPTSPRERVDSGGGASPPAAVPKSADGSSHGEAPEPPAPGSSDM